MGIVLAKRLGLDFIDTDVVIQTREGRRLQEIIDSDGLDALRRIEEDVLRGLRVRNCVIATGGSAVYSEPAMNALKRDGIIVFLDLPLEVLRRRVKDMDTRGMIIAPGESFTDLYHKRLPLYRAWAERVIDVRSGSAEEVAGRIAAKVSQAKAIDFNRRSGAK